MHLGRRCCQALAGAGRCGAAAHRCQEAAARLSSSHTFNNRGFHHTGYITEADPVNAPRRQISSSVESPHKSTPCLPAVPPSAWPSRRAVWPLSVPAGVNGRGWWSGKAVVAVADANSCAPLRWRGDVGRQRRRPNCFLSSSSRPENDGNKAASPDDKGLLIPARMSQSCRRPIPRPAPHSPPHTPQNACAAQQREPPRAGPAGRGRSQR
jgi:hypothetical protein